MKTQAKRKQRVVNGGIAEKGASVEGRWSELLTFKKPFQGLTK